MSQPPPPPPNQPPQEGGSGAPQDPPPNGFGAPQSPPPGGFGAPQDPPPNGFGAPQDPPPGGFGAPQSPPPGGFGAPTPPPGQPPQGIPPNPGYGYPQAPPAPGTPPPTAPPQPYGYPQTQPPGQPGYGYPGQQPQYGYPQPSTMPLQPQAPGGGRKLNAQLMIIVAAVLAIGLIVGGGILYTTTSGDDKPDASGTSGGTGGEDGKGDTSKEAPDGGGSEKVPSSTSAKILFQVPQPEVPDDEVWSVGGSWLTDKVYAKASLNEVIGYDPASGKETWTMPLKGHSCAASPEITEDGVTVVISEGSKRSKTNKYPGCTEVTAFNLNTGKQLWTKSVGEGSEKAKFEEASITGTTVAVGAGLDGGAGFDLTTGKILWQPKVEECEDLGYRGGEQLVAVRKCGDFGEEKLEVQLLNSKDGSVQWTYKLPAGIDNAKVISTKPVVFGVESDPDNPTGTGTSDIFSLDESGKLRTKIAMEADKYDHDCGVGKIHDCKGILVGNDKLYVPTRQHDGTKEYSRTNEVISFSLATGKTAGDRADAGDGYEIFPIRMDGGNIIAYKQGPYDKGSEVVSINGGSFEQTKLLVTPASEQVRNAISSMVPKTSEMLYANGRLFMGQDLISKPSSSSDDEKYTAIGFGAQ
ncbi:outer membrane protein assembly factor BamB family protein [Streptomyces ureilyticus]|uniref:PQQ-binding-like beta-propeller repeat protein n=1 Tax=Streptomyces ureilyticus TaxID=1775131 RepID=A0ABX0E9I4_9ACTN|nr:PQQ-binding-like beta-propeller repeat protein [Streptomyces ureilyticus]NGO48616.1 PQQ-binding-like beta-propeller repeat protein [Streptomyces ureilyticus]